MNNKTIVEEARETIRRLSQLLEDRGHMSQQAEAWFHVRGEVAKSCHAYRYSAEEKKDLESERWKALRETVIVTRDGSCENCRGIDNLQVHHRYYFPHRRMWEYELTDLLLLCRACHSLLHGFINEAEALIRADIAEERAALAIERLQSLMEEFEEENREAAVDAALGRVDDPYTNWDEDNPAYSEVDAPTTEDHFDRALLTFQEGSEGDE